MYNVYVFVHLFLCVWTKQVSRMTFASYVVELATIVCYRPCCCGVSAPDHAHVCVCACVCTGEGIYYANLMLLGGRR